MDKTYTCPLCVPGTPGTGKLIALTWKGVSGVQRAAVAREVTCDVSEGTKVHEDCRMSFINKRSKGYELKKSSSVSTSAPTTRKRHSSECKNECFYCRNTVNMSSLGLSASTVKTDGFVESLVEICRTRTDEWATEVRGYLAYYGFDLHAADIPYHHDCDVCFRTGRQLPSTRMEPVPDVPLVKRGRPSSSGGRPYDSDQQEAFDKVLQFLEAERQATISELVSKMAEYLDDTESCMPPYSAKWMKKRLLDQLDARILVSQQEGGEDLVTFTETVDQIVRDFFRECKSANETEKAQALIKAASKLITQEMVHTTTSMDYYPTPDDMNIDAALSNLPPLLKEFLVSVMRKNDNFQSQSQIAFIGQAILQCAKPRSVKAPLIFGLGVSLYHVFRSRYLIDVLNSFGICCSYSEVLRFVRNAASVGADNPLGELEEGMSVLFSADNVDHNSVTLNGKGTFHGLGIMASVTPAGRFGQLIPRKKYNDVKPNLLTKSKIDIRQYAFANRIRSTIKFEPLPPPCLPQNDTNLDVMWELSFRFKSDTPSWSGMMCYLMSARPHPGKSSFHFLPMIDLHATDYNCLYSALYFMNEVAFQNKIQPVVTFDQPLFWKASEILETLHPSESMKRIVVMLGPFHTQMNFLGAIGYMMSGLGIEEMFSEIYAENVVPHLITGKAVSRALRAHLLLDRAICEEIIEPLFSNPDISELVLGLEKLYVDFVDGKIQVEDILASPILSAIESAISEHKREITSLSRNNSLLVKYGDLVQHARDLIRAERSGDWDLHLATMRKILDVIASAGHYNYTKSLYLYLQKMDKLRESNPTVHTMLKRGLFVCRRTDKFWSGLGCDLSIEQVLMRSLKTRGGLTRGSGMDETQRTLWTMSAPCLSSINAAISNIVGKSVTCSDQHKDMSVSRRSRDHHDYETLKKKISECAPVAREGPAVGFLSNIVTGVQAPLDVNVDDYKTIGAAVLEKMEGQSVFSIRLSRKDRVINMTMATRGVKLQEDRSIDSALMFQRMVIAAQAGDVSLKDALSYELAPYPPALFQSSTMPLKADKPALAQAILKHSGERTDSVLQTPPATDHYVIDGGSLLHRLKWEPNSPYLRIAKSYANFVTARYFRPTVIFDGYATPTVKDSTHVRRSPNPGPTVTMMHKAEFRSRRETVLSNAQNKDQLIKMITPFLSTANCIAMQSRDDADLDLALAACKSAKHRSTTLLGEDTDLLILALYHFDSNSESLYFRSEKQNCSRIYDVKWIAERLGDDIRYTLLFVHSFSGCDTTSRVSGLSKQRALQSMYDSPQLRSIASKFTTPGQSPEKITEIGIEAMALLFGRKTSETLATLRERLLASKILKASSFVTSDRLPPTESATKYHSLRVYFQIMTWLGMADDMNAVNWGWKLVGGRFLPITMDSEPAPKNLLQIVHCECKTGCNTMRCTCRKYGSPCHSGCGPCQVEYCANVTQPENEEDDDGDE